jgi:hypothetical protein
MAIGLLFFGISLTLLIKFLLAKNADMSEEDRMVWRGKMTVCAFVILGLLSFGLFFVPGYFLFYGSQDRPPDTPTEEIGSRKINKSFEDEDSKEVIKQKNEEARPPEVRHQEEGPEKERKEADDYIEKALERARRRNE